MSPCSIVLWHVHWNSAASSPPAGCQVTPLNHSYGGRGYLHESLKTDLHLESVVLSTFLAPTQAALSDTKLVSITDRSPSAALQYVLAPFCSVHQRNVTPVGWLRRRYYSHSGSFSMPVVTLTWGAFVAWHLLSLLGLPKISTNIQLWHNNKINPRTVRTLVEYLVSITLLIKGVSL